MGPPNDRERRHRQPGRRATDPRDFAAGALLEAAVEDRLFPSWSIRRVQKWLALIGSAIAVYAAIATYVAAKIVTRQEVSAVVDSVKVDIKALRGSSDVRLSRIEERQNHAEAVHQLLIPMARLQCLQMRRWDSGTLSEAAGLPCDSLLLRRPR